MGIMGGMGKTPFGVIQSGRGGRTPKSLRLKCAPRGFTPRRDAKNAEFLPLPHNMPVPRGGSGIFADGAGKGLYGRKVNAVISIPLGLSFRKRTERLLLFLRILRVFARQSLLPSYNTYISYMEKKSHLFFFSNQSHRANLAGWNHN